MTDKIYDDGIVGEDGIQHGIDDDPNGDAEKGAALGGMGGAVVGGLAGSMTGPVGTVIGAVAGAAAGAIASGAAVSAVDSMDNDNTVTGLGEGVTPDTDELSLADEPVVIVEEEDTVVTPVDTAYGDVIDDDLNADLPGIQTGGVTTRGEDTRGISEKTADTITGNRFDDKTGGRVL